MPTRSSRLSLGGLVLLGVVGLVTAAGCGSTTGRAEPAEASAQPPALPQRPAELSLTGVEPCSLLTEAQLDQLKVNSKPRVAADTSDGPSCSLDVDLKEPYYSYGIEPITNADLEAWRSGERRNNAMTLEPATVEGFPALSNFRASPDPSDCEALVGVAQGQTLRVQMYPVTEGAFDQKTLCDMAKQAAALAVQTLKSRS